MNERKINTILTDVVSGQKNIDAECEILKESIQALAKEYDNNVSGTKLSYAGIPAGIIQDEILDLSVALGALTAYKLHKITKK